jgi:hypothetical protein
LQKQLHQVHTTTAATWTKPHIGSCSVGKLEKG